MRSITALAALLALGAAAWAQDQQLGARTKAMGGSYTAFEDDPVSIWLNPAGIAVQPDSAAVAYQTYTAYPVKRERAGGLTETSVEAETIMVDPAVIPSFIGFVTQLGQPGDNMALGVCYARPYHIKYAMDILADPSQTTFVPRANVEQSFSRFRVAFAKDFRLKAPNEPGFLTHVAVGAGLDLSYERWDFTQQTEVPPLIITTANGDTTVSAGFGLGVLAALYDDPGYFKINLGAAYQSAIKYDFDIEPDLLPAFNMPQQVNAGLTFYLLEGTPLRVTLDFQWLDWSSTAEKPFFGGQERFEDAFNFSLGVEYRIALNQEQTVFLFPRLGYRRFDAPWGDKDNLPVTGMYKLVMDTDAEAFNIFTYGLGLSWTTNGKLRSVDVAGDAGGDSINLAVGYTHEF